MSQTDLIHRFSFTNADVRGEFVRLGTSLQDVLSRGNYPSPLRSLLSESLCAVVLLSSSLKFDGRLILQARGHGPVSLLVAECSHQRQVRALAHWQGDIPDSPLTAQMGDAQLAITIEPDQGQRYQGIVPLAGERLDACLEDYFAQSEQLPTRLLLMGDGQVAAGLLLQRLPDARGDDDDWRRLVMQGQTVTAAELLQLPVETLLSRLFPEDDIRLHPGTAVSFGCTCSHERSAGAVQALGEDDAYALLAEQGAITIDCQFCGQRYRFDRPGLDRVFGHHSLH